MADTDDPSGWVSGDWRTWPVPHGRLGEDFPDDAFAQASPAQRLAASFEIFDLAVHFVRARLRRELATDDPKFVEEGVRSWLRERPGAEHGDGVGRPVTWPRPPR